MLPLAPILWVVPSRSSPDHSAAPRLLRRSRISATIGSQPPSHSRQEPIMLSRRDVLATTAGLAIASQASGPAGAQPARRIIVDAQVHLWKAHTPERPWPADGIGQAHL